ncbi:nuclear transport factor 2 family protein [Nonomuraea sp. NPDC049400]|uniref:nuclear transport factor 2 family protein n=1 Tax=Nonomuraea sp. NPDC049400 TaxID=3364352 RepID=UPI0037B85C4C
MVEPRPWVEGYVRAWNSNDPDEISALFTEDALYYTEPHNPPWEGRDEIVSQWLGRQDKPGEARFEWQPVSVTDEVSVIQGVTTYPDKTYSNLWVIRFVPDGRCREFTEWWMRQDVK